MSTYTDALLAYHRAVDDFLREERIAKLLIRSPDVIPPPDYVDRTEASAQALAQAGDVLEKELSAFITRLILDPDERNVR